MTGAQIPAGAGALLGTPGPAGQLSEPPIQDSDPGGAPRTAAVVAPPGPLDLAAIKARAERATPGTWEARAYRVYVFGLERIIAACWRPWGPVTGDGSIEADATFIAHARTDVPALLAEVERLRAELEARP